MNDQVETIKYTHYNSRMSNTKLTALMALNVVIAYVLWGIPFSLIFVVALAAWQVLYYYAMQEIAEYKSSLSMMTAFYEHHMQRNQEVADKGTNADETCLTIDKGGEHEG